MHALSSPPDVSLHDLDIAVLEQALREKSRGTMTAPLRDVVLLAIEKWGFPGSVGAAEAILAESRRYAVEPDEATATRVIRPLFTLP
jgi:hypothetical protein